MSNTTNGNSGTARAMGSGSGMFGARAAKRRGVALMLVVVAMGTATILTTAYLLSKDNSAAIGANAQDTAASEWAARSGADVALAILQTDTDWMDDDPEKLLEGFSVAGGTVSVVLTDLAGDPPRGDETELAMTVVADVNGVRTALQRIVVMRPEATLEEAADPEYGEFGIFATEQINLQQGAKVAPWPTSPEFKSGAPVKVSAGFITSDGLTMDADSTMASTELYVRPDANSTLETMINNGHFAGGKKLKVVLPAIPNRLTDEIKTGLANIMTEDLKIESVGDSKLLEGGAYQRLEVRNADVTVSLDDSTGGKYKFSEVRLEDGAVMQIKGKVEVCICGDFQVEDGATVVLADDKSSVKFFVGQNLTVNAAAIGLPPEMAQRPSIDIAEFTEYLNPGQIKVYGIVAADGGVPGSGISVLNGAIAVMNVVAPTNVVSVQKNSAVVGRVTAKSVRFAEGAALYYDPALDDGNGFTAFNGPYYKHDGNPLDGLAAALISYDTTQGLVSFSSHIKAHSIIEVEAIDLPMPGDPTPRDHDKAQEKPWPFIAMAIEEGCWVPGDNEERQEGLYVPLDPSIFDLDKFFNQGLIVAVYDYSDDDDGGIVEDVVEDVGDVLGGLGKILK